MVHTGGQFIIQQIIVQGAPCLLIEHQLFQQSESDAHTHASVNLGRRQSRINQRPCVMNIDKVQKLYLAHGNIHLHLRDGTSEGIGIGLNLGSAFRRQVLAVA